MRALTIVALLPLFACACGGTSSLATPAAPPEPAKTNGHGDVASAAASRVSAMMPRPESDGTICGVVVPDEGLGMPVSSLFTLKELEVKDSQAGHSVVRVRLGLTFVHDSDGRAMFPEKTALGEVTMASATLKDEGARENAISEAVGQATEALADDFKSMFCELLQNEMRARDARLTT